MMSIRDPQIEINKLEEDRIEFELSNTDTSVANALRRVMISEVKTMCIERVDVYQNTSMLTDEFLAHRLGLIPLTYRYNENYLSYCSGPELDMLGTLGHRFMDNRECDCGGECYKCCVTFDLNVKFDLDENPGQVSKSVTSKDLKPRAMVDDLEMTDVLPCHFSNEKDREQAMDDGILIVKLGRGQEIRMGCIAVLGHGKQHAKWSPVSACSFICEPIIVLNKQKLDLLSNDDRSSIRDSCPVQVFGDTLIHRSHSLLSSSSSSSTAIEGVEMEQPLEIKNLERCMFCKECELKCAEIAGRVDHDFLSISRNDKKFIFNVETTGALAPEDVVQQALHVIRKKLLTLQLEIQEKIEDDENQFNVKI